MLYLRDSERRSYREKFSEKGVQIKGSEEYFQREAFHVRVSEEADCSEEQRFLKGIFIWKRSFQKKQFSKADFWRRINWFIWKISHEEEDWRFLKGKVIWSEEIDYLSEAKRRKKLSEAKRRDRLSEADKNVWVEKKNISFNARWQDISLPCYVSAIFTVSYASYCKSTQQPFQRIVSLGVKILLYWDALELGIATFIFPLWRRRKEVAARVI